MTAIVISKAAKRPLQIGKWVRNGFRPAAELQDRIAELAGYAVSLRPKVPFVHHGAFATGELGSAILDSTASVRTRARWAWHSGPFVGLLLIRFTLAKQNNGTVTNPYVRVRVRDASNVIVGDAFGRGGAATGASDDPGSMTVRDTTLIVSEADTTIVLLEPDTDYFAEVTEHDYARLQSMLVREVSLAPDTDNGYPARNQSAGSPVLVSERATPARMLRDSWRRGGAHLWNWWADTDADARVTSSSTYRNLVDDTSTATSAAPGVRLNLGSRARIRGGDVPVVMKVYATDTDGSVRLVNSLGATMIECAIDAGEGWYAVQGALPATDAKYLLHYGTNDALTVYAVSIYQCDTFESWSVPVAGGVDGELDAMVVVRRSFMVTYVATGAEGTDFSIPIGAIISDDYEVKFFGAAGAAAVPWVWDFPDGAGDRTSTSFRVLIPAPLSAGDVFKFKLLLG